MLLCCGLVLQCQLWHASVLQAVPAPKPLPRTKIVPSTHAGGLVLQRLLIACCFAVGGASDRAAAFEIKVVSSTHDGRMVSQCLLVACFLL